MQISKNPRIAPSPTKPQKPAPQKEQSKNGSVLRDLVSIGGTAAAGAAGGVYGLGEGSINGAKANYQKHIKRGAKIGRAALTPVGGALGAIATGLTATVAAIGAPVAAVLATGLGFVGGTAVSALGQVPSSVSQTASAGAKAGARGGRALGAVGAALGTVVGGSIGAVGGLFVALGKGLPKGLKTAKQGASVGGKLVSGVPQFTKNTWNIAYPAGRASAGGLGAAIGGATGAVTATGETIVDGLAGAVKRGSQWGQGTSDYFRGDSSGE